MEAGVGSLNLLLLMLLSGGGLFSGGLLGMPPGERDARLLQCAPADTLYYTEWAARSPGRAGAPGIDGMAADPEIRLLLENVERAILSAIEEEAIEKSPEAQLVGKELPPVIKALLLRPGCLYLKLQQDGSGADSPEGPVAATPWATVLQRLRGALIVSAGDGADEIGLHLEKLVGLLPEQDRAGGLKKQPIPLPVPGLSLTLHREGNDFILALGEGSLESAISALKGESGAGLAANKEFQEQFAETRIERVGSVIWLNAGGGLQQVAQALGVQGAMIAAMAKMVGLDSVQTIVSCAGLDEGQLRKRTSVRATNTSEGVLALAAGRPLTKADFDHVPRDADFVAAYSVSAPKLLQALRKVVQTADPRSAENLEAQLQGLEASLGFSLEKDVFQAFGDAWVLYDSPSQGGVLLSAAVLTLEVKDPQTAYSVFTRVMKMLNDSLPSEFYKFGLRQRGVILGQTKFMDRTVYYINIVGDDDVPFAPAFCVTDRRLYIALHPQPLKAQLRRLEEKDASFADRMGSDVALGAGETIALSWVDTRRIVQLISALVPYVGQSMLTNLQSRGTKIDIFSIPSPRAILPYVTESQSTVTRTAHGLHIDRRGGLPGADLLVPILQMPLLFYRYAAAPVHMQEREHAPAEQDVEFIGR